MPFRLRLMFTADTAGMMQRVDRWGKPFWTKVENGKAVLLGVTVVTVTPLSPPRISVGYSRKRPQVAIPLFLNLLMTFQQREAKLPSLKSVREFRKRV